MGKREETEVQKVKETKLKEQMRQESVFITNEINFSLREQIKC